MKHFIVSIDTEKSVTSELLTEVLQEYINYRFDVLNKCDDAIIVVTEA